jgi:uncharacterized protein (TIGR03435 family)
MKTVVVCALVLILAAPAVWAQSSPAPAKTMAFDVASVKPNHSDGPSNANFPLGPGDVYVPNGGYFSATNFPLVVYIAFAYKLMGNQMQYLTPQLPDWVKSDRYDIQARVEGNPTKDEMRLMIRSLLAERFKLAIHYETRQVPVFALVVWKPGKLGPKLRPHPDDGSPCPTRPPSASKSDSASEAAPASAPSVPADLPALCGGLFQLPASVEGHVRAGARNVTIPFLAGTLRGSGSLDRPVVEQTGLKGTYDFSIEWAPNVNCPPGEDCVTDTGGPTFAAALRDQLGLKLESQKGPVEVMVLDHIERPSEN